MSKYQRILKNSSIKGENDRKGTDKEILTHLVNNLSPNQIARILRENHKNEIDPNYVRACLKYHRYRIKVLNDKFDGIASQRISILEMDETFKGRKNIILVVMDSITGYVFLMRKIKRRDERHIVKALEPVAHILHKARMILTDGAPYFPSVIGKVSPNARHQICLVHVMRNLGRELRKLKKPYSSALKKYKDMNEKVHSLEGKLKVKRGNLKKLKQRYKYWRDKRGTLYKKYGIRPYMKNIHSKYPDLEEISIKLNGLNSDIRSLQKTLKSLRLNLKEYKERLKNARNNLNIKWNAYMRQCKLYREFYSLFLYGEQAYSSRKERFIDKLKREVGNGMVRMMLHLLEKVPGIDAINRMHTDLPLKRNFLNTNAIESFNSRLRPFLDAMRNIGNSTFSSLRIELFRLYINTSRALNPIGIDLAPIEKYGYSLKEYSTADIIVDGLPRGRKSKIFLPDLISELTERKLKAH